MCRSNRRHRAGLRFEDSVEQIAKISFDRIELGLRDRDRVREPAFDRPELGSIGRSLAFDCLELMAELFLAAALTVGVSLGKFRDVDQIERRGLDTLA
jgi:hypothetical protein